MMHATLVRRPAARRPVTAGFDRLFSDLCRDLSTPAFARTARPVDRPAGFAPRVTVEELAGGFRVSADVPGVDRKDLDVKVEQGVLTLSGVRYWDDPPAAPTEPEPDGADAASKPVATDAPPRRSAKFERRIAFRGEIAEDGVEATLRNGVLTVTVPKPPVVKPEIRTVPVGTA